MASLDETVFTGCYAGPARSERDQQIIELRAQKVKVKEIALTFGITRQRVYQILKRYGT